MNEEGRRIGLPGIWRSERAWSLFTVQATKMPPLTELGEVNEICLFC